MYVCIRMYDLEVRLRQERCYSPLVGNRTVLHPLSQSSYCELAAFHSESESYHTLLITHAG